MPRELCGAGGQAQGITHPKVMLYHMCNVWVFWGGQSCGNVVLCWSQFIWFLRIDYIILFSTLMISPCEMWWWEYLHWENYCTINQVFFFSFAQLLHSGGGREDTRLNLKASGIFLTSELHKGRLRHLFGVRLLGGAPKLMLPNIVVF